MLRMRSDAELTQRLQLEDSQSWACVGMADLTLKRVTLKRDPNAHSRIRYCIHGLNYFSNLGIKLIFGAFYGTYFPSFEFVYKDSAKPLKHHDLGRSNFRIRKDVREGTLEVPVVIFYE